MQLESNLASVGKTSPFSKAFFILSSASFADLKQTNNNKKNTRWTYKMRVVLLSDLTWQSEADVWTKTTKEKNTLNYLMKNPHQRCENNQSALIFVYTPELKNFLVAFVYSEYFQK